VIKAAEDSALQYMNFMNVIFAAQKQNILIDACVLDSDSGLLQQACDITGGLYLKVPQMLSLLQYLLVRNLTPRVWVSPSLPRGMKGSTMADASKWEEE